jgi:hypothetical protein
VDNRFGEVPRTAIWGLVFVDADRDRALTARDTERIAGVTVELRQGGTSCSTGTLLGSTQTAADGSYVFPGGSVTGAQVVAGQAYRVCERQPTDFVDGPTLPGDAASSARSDDILITALPATGSGSNHFGEWRRLGGGGGDVPSTITGTVFVDRNRDGALTSADPTRVAGVTVRLVGGDSCSGAEIGRTTTDAQGRYAFPGGNVSAAQVLAGQRYSVCEVQPSGYGDGATLPGGSASTPAPNHIVIGALPVGGSNDNNFGEHGARIAGRVFLDRDNDGQPNGSDAGIGAVQVTLTGGDGAVRTATTAADGRFAFEDLPGGRWTLTEQPAQPLVTVGGGSVGTADGKTTAGTGGGRASTPGSTPSSIADLQLPVAGESVDNLFAEVLGIGISGTVYIDRNRDGTLTSADPGRIAGVTVRLVDGDSCSGTEIGRTRTDELGRYAFPGGNVGADRVVAGRRYSVCEVQPADHADGSTNPGTGGSTPAPNHIVIGALPEGGSSANDFGERAGRIAGRVFLDRNNDGQPNGNDVGIGGVTITLTGGDGRTRSTPTAPDGRFSLRRPARRPLDADRAGRTTPGHAGRRVVHHARRQDHRGHRRRHRHRGGQPAQPHQRPGAARRRRRAGQPVCRSGHRQPGRPCLAGPGQQRPPRQRRTRHRRRHRGADLHRRPGPCRAADAGHRRRRPLRLHRPAPGHLHRDRTQPARRHPQRQPPCPAAPAARPPGWTPCRRPSAASC